MILAAGTYLVDRAWPDGVSLRGRCVRDTVLAADEGTERAAVLDIDEHEEAVRIESVTVGPSPIRAVRVANTGAAVTLEGVLVDRVTDVENPGTPGSGAVLVTDGGAMVAMSLVVRETRSREGGIRGRGVQVQFRARLELRRALLERNRATAVFLGGDGTHAVLEDVVVRDTLAQESDGARGVGLGVLFGARVELRRGVFVRNREFGVASFDDGTEAVLEDVVVRDTLALESDGAFGRGLGGQDAARVELRRGVFERNREFGVYSFDDITRAKIKEIV
ncbi:MAG: hypothetical protein ACFCGT_07065, partial [Sandaracinaceae bacterium]